MRDLTQVLLLVVLCILADNDVFAASFVPIWRDDFDGPSMSKLDRTKWVYEVGYGNSLWGNNEYQTYTDQIGNIRQDGQGHLVVTARKESDGRYTSGRIKTKGRFALKFGKFEARIKIPRGPGLLPAFWLMGSVGQWPDNGEIDIMENVGQSPSTVFSNLHAPGYTAVGDQTVPRDLSDDFHVYAIEWTPGRVSWLLDNVVYKTVTKDDIPAGKRWVFDDQPFYMLLNVAVGGDWPGPPVDNALPQDMVVDWVKVSAYTP
ncbi:glycoside hydrolase family 16 protein [Rhizobium tubonense]|uniref:glycoside hydrolase family 16 protein n=1 Tax=Rhizobium tubonense TaxID=484088 RepID=UPI0011B43B07|nr:glycoside hydrolase family 16 protein [Rhizobium tubonense]